MGWGLLLEARAKLQPPAKRVPARQGPEPQLDSQAPRRALKKKWPQHHWWLSPLGSGKPRDAAQRPTMRRMAHQTTIWPPMSLAATVPPASSIAATPGQAGGPAGPIAHLPPAGKITPRSSYAPARPGKPKDNTAGCGGSPPESVPSWTQLTADEKSYRGEHTLSGVSRQHRWSDGTFTTPRKPGCHPATRRQRRTRPVGVPDPPARPEMKTSHPRKRGAVLGLLLPSHLTQGPQSFPGEPASPARSVGSWGSAAYWGRGGCHRHQRARPASGPSLEGFKFPPSVPSPQSLAAETAEEAGRAPVHPHPAQHPQSPATRTQVSGLLMLGLSFLICKLG